MRKITKGPEPHELTHYKFRPDAVYDGPHFTEVKEKIRISLLAEQGHLCAYCMQRISEGAMQVEHWQCQRNFRARQLDYQNVLGVCSGNQGQPKNNQTCDTRKGDADLCFNPSDNGHHDRLEICYTRDGKIHSRNSAFDIEISQVLNLNWYRLVQNRKGVWDGITDALARRDGTRTRSQLQRFIAKWSLPDAEGKLNEYCDVAIYYLEKKLKRTK
ncbi:hypothetical protein QUF80_06255 [Desulfococcaceae bacterium HSG8]|nr:hypothetical protein [Desulfococcaceae bacterium HSG8]